MLKDKQTDEAQPTNIHALLPGLSKLGIDFKLGDTVFFGPRIPRRNRDKDHAATAGEDEF